MIAHEAGVAADMIETQSSLNSRQSHWTPPARPEWVAQFNAVVGAAGIGGLVPLDAKSLIGAARQITGLDDFGKDDWREPFELFVQSLEHEASLNPMGRLLTRADLVRLLAARLEVEHAYTQDPSIEDEHVDDPVFVIGQGRTGTSILQKLLGLDPANRTLLTWECMSPAAGQQDAAAIDQASAHFGLWTSVAPQLERIHDWGGDEPIETILAEAMSFQTPAWLNLLGLTPTYTASITESHRINSLQYAKRVMKLRQRRAPGGRWVVKSPEITAHLPVVLRVFPDARLIWPHRDPIMAMASAVNMIGTFVWARSDVVPPATVFDFLTDAKAASERLCAPIAWIEDGTIPEGQLAHAHYERLVSDPLGALEDIYAQIGLQLSDSARKAIGEYFTAHPPEGRVSHKYSTGDQARIAEEREQFSKYQSYFGVKSEI
jgi:hypothetical protein